MDEKSLQKLEKKAVTVERQLIGELYLVKDLNDILAFTQTYIANYLPVLFYSVKNFSRNQIARLMNSSILIDRLLSIRISDVVRFQVGAGVREFIDSGAEAKDESSLIKLYNNLSSISKANLSSTLLFMFSLIRSTMFSFYCNNKLYLNYGIGWSNLLFHFLENPHLIFFLDNKDIDLAEKELDTIENDLSSIGGKLESEIDEVLIDRGICTEDECSKITKHFLGLKFDWLKSKMLISYCKFLKSNDRKFIDDAVFFSDSIIESLENHDTDYHPMSFRDKLSTPGPSPMISDIIGDLQRYDKILQLFNYIAYFESPDERCVIVFPTDLDFYFNYNLVNKKSNRPVLEDDDFILEHHNRGCFALLGFRELMVPPSESAFYERMKHCNSTLKEFRDKGLSNKFIYSQLKNSQIKDTIITAFENKVNKRKVVSNVLGMSIIAVFNHFAEARGFAVIPAYVNTTVPLITELVMSTIYKSKYDEVILELTKEDDDTNILGIDDSDDYQSIVELEKQIECLEESSKILADYINLTGLKDIFELNKTIMSLIKSTKSVDEINQELQHLYGLNDDEE